jgi:hypothetical protein
LISGDLQALVLDRRVVPVQRIDRDMGDGRADQIAKPCFAFVERHRDGGFFGI